MKKTIFTIIASLLLVSVSAQAPSKKSIVFDYFGRTTAVTTAARDMVRAAALTSFTNSGRLNVIDATNTTALQVSSEAAEAEVAPTVDNIRQSAMKESGGNYLVTGQVTKVGSTREKTSEGRVYYSGIIAFTINVVDLETGNNVAARDFSYMGLNAKTGSTSDEAITQTVDFIPMSMKKFINENFKLETKVVQINEEKKGKVTQVFINAGSAVGITKSQIFQMFVESEVAGIKRKMPIGKLTVESVEGEELTLCNVSKPSEAIKEYMNSETEIIVVSAGERAGAKIGAGLGAAFK